MSDKKTPTHPPSAQDTSEQEFERFLRGEDTATAATYRKLASAEPDAQLDARVRALARRALHESPAAADAAASGDAAREATGRTRGARWMPAFASAAVLVLAAGVVWQLGPRNWARKDATTDVALDATVARNATPGAVDAAPRPVAKAASQLPLYESSAGATAAKSTGALQPDAAGAAKAPQIAPQAFPQEPSRPRVATPRVSEDSARVESRKQEAARDATALAERAPESRERAREKRASDAPGELKKAPADATMSQNLAARAAPDDRVANSPAANSPAPVAAERAAAAPPAPAPAVSAETTPRRDAAVAQVAAPARVTSTTSPPASPDAARASAFPAAPATAAPPGDARRLDEVTPQQAPQRASARAESPPISNAQARPAPPPPPPAPAPAPPMQAPPAPGAFAPEIPAASATAAAKPKASSSIAAGGAEAQEQAYADHFALPPGSPPVKIAGRPTAAELAAWPAPNCHAAGTTRNPEVRRWYYPPDVPDSAHLRVAIVKQYLELESPEGALKAYADFRHCYPNDRWPASLLRRLGTQ